MKELWVEKYRPKTVDGYVFRDDNQRKQITTWIKDKSIPHLLLSGSPGIGKTTLAKMLISEIGVGEYDVLEMNASRERGIKEVQERITNFVSMIPFGPFKVVLLDEADYLTPEAQAALRGVMEEYSSTSRFILTCNHPNKVIPAIHSRCQSMHFTSIDQTEFTARVATILVEENIDFDLDTLDTYVKTTYPDLRKCINFVQQNVQDEKLLSGNNSDAGQADYKIAMVELFKQRKLQEARKLICSSARPEELGGVFRWMYDNIELFGVDEETRDSALLIIKQGLVDHSLIADPEINLSATLVKLGRLSRGQ
jgi:replication factor C small subunit